MECLLKLRSTKGANVKMRYVEFNPAEISQLVVNRLKEPVRDYSKLNGSPLIFYEDVGCFIGNV